MVNRPPHAMLGQSRAIMEILDEARFVSATDFKVLLTGESGVGKALLAQFIHENSPRRQRDMLSVNCSGVPDSGLETDLFDQSRGSVTDAPCDAAGLFERAHGSTLLLDEIGELGPHLQALLLRVLESGAISRGGSNRGNVPVDVRIISATNRNLLQCASEHAFRIDLYYRLNVVHLQIPALRERREDIAVLMGAQLKVLSEDFGLPPCELGPSAIAALEAYTWPGNIRELHHVAELLAVTYPGRMVTVDRLPETVLPGCGSTPCDAASVRSSVADAAATACYERITKGLESFWTVVYERFMARQLTRATVQTVVARGLRQTNGSYRALTTLFNLPATDHTRLLNFLQQHNCYPRPQAFRVAVDDAVRVDASRRRKAAG